MNQRTRRSNGESKEADDGAPVLAYYDPHSELVIECDASERGLGAALLQNGKPIGYASRAQKLDMLKSRKNV